MMRFSMILSKKLNNVYKNIPRLKSLQSRVLSILVFIYFNYTSIKKSVILGTNSQEFILKFILAKIKHIALYFLKLLSIQAKSTLFWRFQGDEKPFLKVLPALRSKTPENLF